MSRYCTKCGVVNDDTAQFCTACQAPLSPVAGYQPMQSVNPVTPGSMTDYKSMGADKKLAAGLCGILLGSLGVHKFILGYTTEGIIMLVTTIVVSAVTCGILWPVMWAIGLIEGIIYLTKSDEEFVRTYIQNKKGWF
jgi:TM2 domain-containing membrane protein YozV